MNEKQTLFIQKYPSCRSAGSATVKLMTKEEFIKCTFKDRYDLQYCVFSKSGYSNPMCSMTIDEFLEIFSKDEIEQLKALGKLNYCDDTRCLLCQKYPMFSAKIYKKFGVKVKCK